ncbi:MAG TPA: hypothetical protein PLX34_20815 [Sedimentisphaerales bacterium]|jgi:hypothetical protein|nr:hypothetical protein [Sedimentisphaerales bacterium]HQN36175.1 hypothetical protein [Sedimentisphaerales bacterium]
MTNEEYRKQRGTEQPFQGTDKQVKRRWYEMNKEAILARRKREKAFKGTRWSRLDRRTNPELYETDDED